MSRRMLVSTALVVVSILCADPFLGEAIQVQRTGELAAPSDLDMQAEEGQDLLELAFRAELPKELQFGIREGIQSWMRGNPRLLREIEGHLEAAEDRMRLSESLPRQINRVELLRDALKGLYSRASGSESRVVTKGLTGSIQGRLTDANSGLPLDFEFVEVYNALGEFVDQDLTDEGDYLIEGLSPGTYFVLTDTSNHLDELYDDKPCPKGVCNVTNGTPVQVAQNANTTGVDFELTNGGRIIGTVTDAVSGLPLFLEFVLVFNPLGDLVGLDLTDSAGNYLIGGLPTGTYHALVDADDHLDELYDDIPCPLEACLVTSGTPIAVTLGNDTLSIDFALDTGGRILGTVTEQVTGLPLDFELVEIYNALGDEIGLGFTDSGGNYLVGGLPSGIYFAGTHTFGDYFDELYNNLPCPNRSCDSSSGTPIPVDENGDTIGVDFVLSSTGPSATPRLTERSGLIVPIVVDLSDPDGRTTFFAVHSTADSPQAVEMTYYTATVGVEPIRTDQLTLDPAATSTFNVRNDLTGYDTSGAEQLVGLVLITEQGAATAPRLVGDFFSVDSSNDFASGDKLIRATDLCNRQKIRFVDFGSGTEFGVLLNEPRGAGTPSFSYTAYDQSGAIVGAGEFFSEAHFTLVDRSVFATQSFGVLDVDFGNALGGHISATYSAFGRFSVGVGGECIR